MGYDLAKPAWRGGESVSLPLPWASLRVLSDFVPNTGVWAGDPQRPPTEPSLNRPLKQALGDSMSALSLGSSLPY